MVTYIRIFIYGESIPVHIFGTTLLDVCMYTGRIVVNKCLILIISKKRDENRKYNLKTEETKTHPTFYPFKFFFQIVL